MENSDFYNGLKICEECRFYEDENEHINLKNVKYCAACGWPINKVINKREVANFLKGFSLWLKKKSKFPIFGAIRHFVKKENLYLCRYDFFENIEKILENYDQKLAKEFNKEFTKKFDFQGSIIS